MTTLSISSVTNSSTVGTPTITKFPEDLDLTELFGPFNSSTIGEPTITLAPMLYPEFVVSEGFLYGLVVDAGELFLAPSYLPAAVTTHQASLSFDWTAPSVQVVVTISSPRILAWREERTVGGIVGDDDLTFRGIV